MEKFEHEELGASEKGGEQDIGPKMKEFIFKKRAF